MSLFHLFNRQTDIHPTYFTIKHNVLFPPFQAMKFVEYAVVFPTAPLGLTPDPALYMKVIGVVEVTSGVLLAASPSPRLRLYSSLGLMAIMVGAVQTLICNGEYADTPVAVICFSALLLALKLQNGGKREATSGGADDMKDANWKQDQNQNNSINPPSARVFIDVPDRQKAD